MYKRVDLKLRAMMSTLRSSKINDSLYIYTPATKNICNINGFILPIIIFI
jgi:hypothetical protein